VPAIVEHRANGGHAPQRVWCPTRPTRPSPDRRPGPGSAPRPR
jgi:hypothetical protein